MTPRPVCESSWPVGSSARSRSGRLASARAIATRCCSPPDSSCGRWLRAAAEARRARAARGRAGPARAARRRARRSGTSTFSAADRIGMQPERLEDEADLPAPEADELDSGMSRDRRPVDRDAAPRRAGRGRRSSTAASSCPSRSGRAARPAGPGRRGGHVAHRVDHAAGHRRSRATRLARLDHRRAARVVGEPALRRRVLEVAAHGASRAGRRRSPGARGPARR